MTRDVGAAAAPPPPRIPRSLWHGLRPYAWIAAFCLAGVVVTFGSTVLAWQVAYESGGRYLRWAGWALPLGLCAFAVVGRLRGDRRWRVGALALACGATFMVLDGTPIGWSLRPVLSTCTFDGGAWRADVRGEKGGYRMWMARDLIARGVLVGQSAQHADMLFGPDDDDRDVWPQFDRAWRLGSGFIDDEWLVLRLGSDGRVATASVVND